LKLFVLLAWLLFASLNSLAQVNKDSIHNSAAVPTPVFTKALQLSNPERKILLKKGRRVWVQVQDTKGNIKMRRAVLTKISDHEFTVKPIEFLDKELTFTDSTLAVIGYTNAGIIIPVFILNTMVVSLAIIWIPAAILTGVMTKQNDCGCSDAMGVGEVVRWTIPFYRKIKFNGKGKWKLRTVEIAARQKM